MTRRVEDWRSVAGRRGERGGGGSLIYAACRSAILPIWSGPQDDSVNQSLLLLNLIMFRER
jgi:hypothetical protein